MKKALTAVAAAATLAVVSLAAPSDAEARSRGGAVAAGVIGGLAAGAIIGSAISQPAYGGYYAAPAPVYVAPPQRYCEDYVWSHRAGGYVLRRFPC
jgi:hypothetical protein